MQAPPTTSCPLLMRARVSGRRTRRRRVSQAGAPLRHERASARPGRNVRAVSFPQIPPPPCPLPHPGTCQAFVVLTALEVLLLCLRALYFAMAYEHFGALLRMVLIVVKVRLPPSSDRRPQRYTLPHTQVDTVLVVA